MSVLVKKSFAWIWMAALMTATMGVSVHQIYCYCAGMESVSFFAIQDECSSSAKEEVASCCAKKAPAHPSCCKKSDAAKQKKHHGCTKKTTRFFQLKTEFTLSEKDFGKIAQHLLALPVAPNFEWLSVCEATIQSAGIQSFPNPPPPLSGRMICVRHCTALC